MAPGKHAKTTAKEGVTPLTSFRQALRLIRQQQPLCGDVSSDPIIAEKLRLAIASLTAQIPSGQQAEHSLDLDVADEPPFLLASAHLQLGLLYRRQDKLTEAQQELRLSLQYFPTFVAAHSALGQVLKSAAASQEQLQQAEEHLQQAILTAEQLLTDEGGLLVDSNKACAAELEAADAARSALAMLLCQAGRGDEAVKYLTALGFKYRLSNEVLQYALPTNEATSTAEAAAQQNSADFLLQVLDNALPQQLLEHLQQVFAADAPFWKQHHYGRVGYFSYCFRMDDPQSTSMHQLAHHLRQLALQYCPDAADAQYAEFWAHCRRHSSGHQLHYDSDDEGQGGVRNPIFTSVLYLAPNTCDCGQPTDSTDTNGELQPSFIGGPTLVTDQVLGGQLATKGWLAYPATNRFIMFDGRYLHGVIPGRGPSPSADGRRTTLMMAFWRDLKTRAQPGTIGACMHMPTTSSSSDGNQSGQWTTAVTAKRGGWGSCRPVPLKAPMAVSTVWQPIAADGKPAGNALYDVCFQGF